MIRLLLVALLAVLALVTAACGGGGTNASSSTAQRRLTDLHDMNQLRAVFDQASSQPRLIVLVSPT